MQYKNNIIFVTTKYIKGNTNRKLFGYQNK